MRNVPCADGRSPLLAPCAGRSGGFRDLVTSSETGICQGFCLSSVLTDFRRFPLSDGHLTDTWCLDLVSGRAPAIEQSLSLSLEPCSDLGVELSVGADMTLDAVPRGRFNIAAELLSGSRSVRRL